MSRHSRKRPNGTGSIYYTAGSARWNVAFYIHGERRRFEAPSYEEAEDMAMTLALALKLRKDLDETYREWRSTYEDRQIDGDFAKSRRAAKRLPMRKNVSTRLRFAVLHRDKFACRYCGAKAPECRLVMDHVIAVAGGGKTDMDNLVTACSECNAGKAALEIDLSYLSAVEESAS